MFSSFLLFTMLIHHFDLSLNKPATLQLMGEDYSNNNTTIVYNQLIIGTGE